MADKKYYWIKLYSSFLTSEKVDFLMSQKDGANYIVLYQMLCLKTINSNGLLASQLGEMIIPYDIDKIQRDCKHFNIDTIRVALELYKNLGMIYEEDNGMLQIAEYGKMVGSSKTNEQQRLQGAIRQQRFRDKQKQLESVTVTQDVTLHNALYRNTEYRDKSLDIRDIDIEIEKDIEKVPCIQSGYKLDTESSLGKFSLGKDSIDYIQPTENGSSKKKPKHKYGEYKNVLLTDEELEKLKAKFTNYLDLIKKMDEGIELKGYKYKSHYLAILKWNENTKQNDQANTKNIDVPKYEEMQNNIEQDDEFEQWLKEKRIQ